MKFCLRIILLLFLVSGTRTQDEFNLADAIDDLKPTPAKPKEQPKTPQKPEAGGGLDLNDAVVPDTNPKPDKPVVNPPKSGEGGRTFDDSDLSDVSGGDYKPDQSGRGRGVDPGYDSKGGVDKPQGETGSGPIAGIVSAIGVALLGAASSYFAYQKKKLCFKIQGGADPESGKGQHGAQSDPQVFSDLLRTN